MIAPSVADAVTGPAGQYDFTLPGGFPYSLRIGTFGYPTIDASSDNCVGLPPPGKTNLFFFGILTNSSKDRTAPVPTITFQTNLNSGGTTADATVTTIARAFFHSVAVSPSDSSACGVLTRAAPIPSGGGVLFSGSLGPVSENVPLGTTLLVRVADQTGFVDLAPIPYTAHQKQ